MPEARVFRRAGRGKSASPVRRGESEAQPQAVTHSPTLRALMGSTSHARPEGPRSTLAHPGRPASGRFRHRGRVALPRSLRSCRRRLAAARFLRADGSGGAWSSTKRAMAGWRPPSIASKRLILGDADGAPRKASPVINRQQGNTLISVSWNYDGTFVVPADLEFELRLRWNGTREIPDLCRRKQSCTSERRCFSRSSPSSSGSAGGTWPARE